MMFQDYDQEHTIEELYYRLREPEGGIQLSQKRIMLKNFKNCFQGTDFVSWLVANTKRPKFVAEQIAQHFMDRLFIRRVEDEHDKTLETVFTNDGSLYRFVEDEDSSMINCIRLYSGYSRPAREIVQDMFESLKRCYETCVVNEESGKPIDYATLVKSKEYKQFVADSVHLQMVQPALEMKNEKDIVGFFLTVMKILIVHVNLEKYKPVKTSLFHRPRDVFSRYGYLIGGQKYSLTDIEHGILRGNRKPHNGNAVFSKTDPRKAFSDQTFDPRIHFLLINGNGDLVGYDLRSSMTLFDSKNIQKAIEESTIAFISNDEIVKVQSAKKTIILPRVFRDYRSDFGKDQTEVLQWIARLCPSKKKLEILSLLELPRETLQVQYVGLDDAVIETENLETDISESSDHVEQHLHDSESSYHGDDFTTPSDDEQAKSRSNSRNVEFTESIVPSAVRRSNSDDMLSLHAGQENINLSWKRWKPLSSKAKEEKESISRPTFTLGGSPELRKGYPPNFLTVSTDTEKSTDELRENGVHNEDSSMEIFPLDRNSSSSSLEVDLHSTTSSDGTAVKDHQQEHEVGSPPLSSSPDQRSSPKGSDMRSSNEELKGKLGGMFKSFLKRKGSNNASPTGTVSPNSGTPRVSQDEFVKK